MVLNVVVVKMDASMETVDIEAESMEAEVEVVEDVSVNAIFSRNMAIRVGTSKATMGSSREMSGITFYHP